MHFSDKEKLSVYYGGTKVPFSKITSKMQSSKGSEGDTYSMKLPAYRSYTAHKANWIMWPESSANYTTPQFFTQVL
jgi:hypothetical protein